MAKLFPFWWLVPPEYVELEEGDYSTWTVYHDLQDDDLVGVALYDALALFNENASMALFVRMGSSCKPYTVATKSLGASLFEPAYMGGSGTPYKESAYRTYAVFVNYDEDTVHILKDSALVESHPVTALGHTGFEVVGVSISPDGHYIVVALQKGWPTSQGYWVVLQGS